MVHELRRVLEDNFIVTFGKQAFALLHANVHCAPRMEKLQNVIHCYLKVENKQNKND
jgi:hypothetical protein